MTRFLGALLAVIILVAPHSSTARGEQGKSRFSFPTRKSNTKTKDINFNDLKFEIKKGQAPKQSMLTDKIKKLRGQKVKIRGWILPTSVFEQKGFNKFVLVRDNRECCFGPGAAIYDCIVVDMEKGKTTDFSVRPITLEGKFNLKPLKGPNGKYLAIYHVTASKVKR